MRKGRGAVPLAKAGLDANLLVRRGGVPDDKGVDGLQAAVVWAGVDALNGRVETREVRGELVGLRDAVRGQGWVGGDAGWGGQWCVVGAAGGVDDPVGAELAWLCVLAALDWRRCR